MGRFIAPPSVQALAAAASWWDTVPEDQVDVFINAGLGPLMWWTSQERYLEATVALAAAAEPDLPAPKSAIYAWEFEFGTAFGGMEVGDWSRRKTWGKLLRIRPVTIEDPWSRDRMGFAHNERSPWRQKWEQREWMKKRLPSKLRSLVNKARSRSLTEVRAMLEGGWIPSKHVLGWGPACELLKRSIDFPAEFRILEVKVEEEGVRLKVEIFHPAEERLAGAVGLISSRLGMDVRTFWRACGGKDMVRPPVESGLAQLEMFS